MTNQPTEELRLTAETAYIHDTTVDVAEFLEGKQASAMRAIVEDITLP